MPKHSMPGRPSKQRHRSSHQYEGVPVGKHDPRHRHGKDEKEKDDSYDSGGAAGRMGGMPMGAMYGGGGVGATSGKDSNAATPDPERESTGTNVYDLGSEPQPDESTSGTAVADDVVPVDTVGVGGNEGPGAQDYLDDSPMIASGAVSAAANDSGAIDTADVDSAAQATQAAQDAAHLNPSADIAASGAGAAAMSETVQNASLGSDQSDVAIDLRRLLEGLGFSTEDSDLIVRVISDGLITNSELEQLRNIEYRGLPDYLLGDDESETVEIPLPESPAIDSATDVEEVNVNVPENSNGKVDPNRVESPEIDTPSVNVDEMPPTKKARITIDKDGNIHIDRLDDKGNPTTTIDIDNDNNIDVNTYDYSGLNSESSNVSDATMSDEDNASLDDIDAPENTNSVGEFENGGTTFGRIVGGTTGTHTQETSDGSSSNTPSDNAATADSAPVIPAVVPPAAPARGDSSDSHANAQENASSRSNSNTEANSRGTSNSDGKQNTTGNNQNSSSGRKGTTSASKPAASDFERLSTEYFADAEKAAREVAETVRNLRTEIQVADYAASQKWLGKGHKEFKNLAYTIEIQLKDISEEFWSFYEDLTDAHAAYLEADEEAATNVNAIRDGK